jgi:hypothetical protein
MHYILSIYLAISLYVDANRIGMDPDPASIQPT